jgi:hypothetical protein
VRPRAAHAGWSIRCRSRGRRGDGARNLLTVREDAGCDPGFFYIWRDERWGPFWAYSSVGDTIRVWIVDVGGTLLFIEAETTKQAGSDLDREIQQIVESIRFD